MKRINPDYIEAISHHMNSCPFWTLMSMKIGSLEWGISEIVMEVEDKHLQPMGIAHGGVLATIVDTTSYWAVYPQLEEGMGLTTLEMKLNYLSPPIKGRIVGHGRCIRLGQNVALADARILDSEGRLLSYGTTTMLILEGADYSPYPDFAPKSGAE